MAPNPKWQVYEATSHSAPRPVRIPHWQVQEDHHSDTGMKALAHRLRGRRASRRDDAPGDETERSFRFEEAVKEDATTDRRDDNWRKNRGINSKTGSCNVLAALATASTHATDDKEAVPPSFVNSPPLLQPQQSRTASASNMTRVESPQPHRHLNRANSNSRVNNAAAAAALRPNRAMTDVSSSSSSTQSSSSIGRSRSRHGGSMSSNASFLSVSNQKPEVVVDVRYSGYLAIKRGLLKVADKRYYFVARRNPELYSCKDETSFNLWLASGHPLDPHGGDGIAKASGLSPVLMGTVLRVDDGSGEEAGNGSNHSDKVFTVMVGSASKCFTLKFGAESGEKAMQWIEALQEVQVTKRNGTRHHTKLGSTMDKKMLLSLNEHNALRGTASEKSASDAEIVATDVVLLAEEGSEPVTRPASTSNAKMPRVYAGGKLQSKPLSVEEDEATAVSTPTSYTESSPTTSDHVEHFAPTTTSLPPSRLHRMDSVTSGSSTASGQSQNSNVNGNVLLFVPVAGSSLTASASRMAKAQQELSALVAKGAKLPARVMQDPTSSEAIEWRYGVPQYVLTDLAYIKGRMREPDTTPLASYVEECCQTFIMEATHKARFDQWQSVIQNSFYLQVNDGVQVPGSAILENDMLGLLYLGDTGAGHGDSDDNQDPRAELAEAFPDGFPMEVLDVFTQPPQCYFSWRHWGAFTGKYRGVKGDGSKMEVRGFGEMTVDASRMRSLRLFFKQRDLISGLQQATDRIGRARRDTATISALNAGRTVRATSAAVAPVTQKEAVPNPKTSDIIEGLANFTLEAQEHQRKHTR